MPLRDFYYLGRTYDQDRERGLERRIEITRALREARALQGAPADRQTWLASKQIASRRGLTSAVVAGTGLVRHFQTRVQVMLAVRGMGHSLTEYPCRLPDGSIGRTAILSVHGQWVAVCVSRSRA